MHASSCVRAAGKLLLAVFVVSVPGNGAYAQGRQVHPLHAGVMPPGAIGGQRLVGVGPLSGKFQPVEIRGPSGSQISLLEGDAFGAAEAAPRKVGLSLAQVYRLKISAIPGAPGLELFPTIELLDHLSPPPGEEARFAIPAEFTAEDLRLAARGAFITRVVYVEDPNRAIPASQDKDSLTWFEADRGDDPLMIADELGRPVAILRLGGRIPLSEEQSEFTFGSPTWIPVPDFDGSVPTPQPAFEAHRPAGDFRTSR